MAVTAFLYGAFFGTALNKEIDLLSDAIKCSIHTSTYTPAQDTDNYWDDATNEVTSANYTAGGVALTTPTFTYTGGSNLWTYDADNASWTPVTFTGRYAVVYDSTPGTSATDPLICYQNFGGDFTATGGTFTVAWNASGIFTITLG